MTKMNRRDTLRLGSASLALPLLAAFDADCVADENPAAGSDRAAAGGGMKVQYLEVVTPAVDAVCNTYEQVHGLEFGKPEASLGNARTAELPGGGWVGVRAPLRATEAPIVRPYFLVEDIDAAAAAAAASGATIALPPMELPGFGKCAVYLQGGTQQGLWQLADAAG